VSSENGGWTQWSRPRDSRCEDACAGTWSGRGGDSECRVDGRAPIYKLTARWEPPIRERCRDYIKLSSFYEGQTSGLKPASLGASGGTAEAVALPEPDA